MFIEDEATYTLDYQDGNRTSWLTSFEVGEFHGNCGYRILHADSYDSGEMQRLNLTPQNVADVLMYLLLTKYHSTRMIIFSEFTHEANRSVFGAMLKHPVVTTSQEVLQNSSPLATPIPNHTIQMGSFSPFMNNYRIDSGYFVKRKRSIIKEPVLPGGIGLLSFKLYREE